MIGRGCSARREHRGSGLHHLLAFHNPAALVSFVGKLAAEPFQNRSLRLLDLQEQRLVVVGHEQCHAAECADGSDAALKARSFIVKRSSNR